MSIPGDHDAGGRIGPLGDIEAEIRLLAGIARAMQDVVILIDLDLRMTRCVTSAEPLVGWTDAEIIGSTPFERFDPEFPDGDGPVHIESLRTGRPTRVYARLLRKDGSRVDTDVVVTPMADTTGRKVGMFAVLRDVSVLKATERELRASQARLRSILDHAPDAMLLTRTDGAILEVNAAATELFGRTEAELLVGGRAGLVVPDADLAKALEGRERGGKIQADLRYRRSDGTTFIGETTSNVFGHDGPWQLSSLIVRDVSERRRLEQERRDSEARLSFVLDGSNDGFWDWDIASGRVQYSRRWASMLGYDLSELKPDLSTWERLVHPDEVAGINAVLEAHLRGETDHYAYEHRLRAKDGSWVWVLDRGKVVERDATGKPIRAAGTHTDITARKVAEDALRAALAENKTLVEELRDALAHVKTLAGFLPICMHCKKIRDDHGYWERIDKYITEHTDTRFSHGICPDCVEKYYPELKRPAI